MANIRTRATASGPRDDVKFHVERQTPHEDLSDLGRRQGLQEEDGGRAARWPRGSLDPKGGERLFGPLCRLLARASPRQGPAADAGHKAGVPGSAAVTPASSVRWHEAPPDHARTSPPLARRVESRLAGPGSQVLPGPPCHPRTQQSATGSSHATRAPSEERE